MFTKNSSYYNKTMESYFFNIASPCGLFARSYFIDTYNLTYENGTFIKFDETGIANKYLKNKFFKRRKDYKIKQWIDVENDFINWMNVETFNFFRKLWDKIYINLNPGIYYLIIKDNYDVLK